MFIPIQVGVCYSQPLLRYNHKNIRGSMGKLSSGLKKIFQDQINVKVIDMAAFKMGTEIALDNLSTTKSVEALIDQGHSPSSAIYINMQNLVSVLMETLIMLPPAAAMNRFFSKQEDLYEPGYPPHSPITNSYYNFWLQFDAAFGDDKETVGTCILDMADILKIEGIQSKALANLCNSRMGIYEISDIREDRTATLRELLSDRVYEIKFDIHFSGQSGDIVYVRLLPDLFENGLSITLGVPYQLCGYAESEWSSYFSKYGIIKGSENFEKQLHEHMKYGKDRNYWAEFTFWAYMQHRPDVIYLTGLPDNVYSQAAHSEFNAKLKYSMAYRKIESRLI